MKKSFLFSVIMLAVVGFTAPVHAATDEELCNKYYKANKFDEAFPVCKKSAEQGVAEGQYCVGEMYFYGKGVKRDYEKGLEWYEKAAENKSSDHKVGLAQIRLGFIHLNMTNDYVKAFKYFKMAAERNDPFAQYQVGLMYAGGHGVKQNYKKAVEFYKKAARYWASAYVELGKLYLKGYGVRQNRDEAKEHFGLACDNGLQDGCDLYREMNEGKL